MQAEPIHTDTEDAVRRREAAVALLQSWRDEESEAAQDQLETWQYLQSALNKHRLSERKKA